MTLTNSAIVTSRSTLMHASLAHISQELQTMDFIIQDTSKASLPTEILIIIRGWLFPMITAQLLAQSAAALLAYETSLRNLLCPDCVAYNFDIYGPDVWHWEQFSGACSCLETVEPGRRGHGRVHAQSHGKCTKPNLNNTGSLNPKQFHDSLQWLEHHLSNETAIHAIKHRDYCHSVSSNSVCSWQATVTNIWDVVDNVLREFNCKVNHESDDMRAYNRVERGQSKNKHDLVRIVPLQPDLDAEKNAGAEIDADWLTYILLRRTSGDLGLLLEYPQSFDASRSITPPFTRRSRWTSSSDTHYIHSLYHHPNDLAKLVSDVFCFIASLPITFATVTLTILCFYTKPRSLRIL